MSWSPGAERIRELIDTGELERVQASDDVAQRLLDDADQHIASARAIADSGDLSGAATGVHLAAGRLGSARTRGPRRARETLGTLGSSDDAA